MNIGLLWFDGKHPLEKAVVDATQHYEERFGVAPNVCYVNPAALPDGEATQVQEVEVRPSARILEHHYWIGVEATE